MIVIVLAFLLILSATFVGAAAGYYPARLYGIRRSEAIMEFLRVGGHGHARRASRARALEARLRGFQWPPPNSTVRPRRGRAA